MYLHCLLKCRPNCVWIYTSAMTWLDGFKSKYTFRLVELYVNTYVKDCPLQLDSLNFRFHMQHSFGWWAAQVNAPAEWRSSTKASGELCVMMNGTWPMPMWYVDRLAAAMRFLLLRVPTLAEALVQYGWIMWSVQAKSLLSHTAGIPVLEKITAGTVKMLALSVWVRGLAHFESMHVVIASQLVLDETYYLYYLFQVLYRSPKSLLVLRQR